MGRRVRGDGWAVVLPDGLRGGSLQHTHTHLRTMALYRGSSDDGSELEVIITTYPGHGGIRSTGRGRREQRTQLDIDSDVPPVETIVIVATGDGGPSVCLVLHRPLGAPAGSSEAVAGTLVLTPA